MWMTLDSYLSLPWMILDVVIRDNLFHGRTSLRESGVGEISGQAFEKRFPKNRYFKDDNSPPEGPLVVVRPNPYERNRAHIIIYNWEEWCEIGVDLSALDIPVGVRYELRSVQDYFGDRSSGIYHGRELTVPMNGWTAAKPVGDYSGKLPETLPRFGAFVLTWRVTPWSNRRNLLSRFLLGPRPRVTSKACAPTPRGRDAKRPNQPTS